MSSPDPWQNDKLGRKPEADLLQKYLCSVSKRKNHPHGHKSFVLNLKSGWGTGKTFFLNSLAQQLRHEKHIVAVVDIWRADQDLDPLVTIVSRCRDELEPHTPKSSKIGNTLKSATNNAGKVLALTSSGLAQRMFAKTIGIEFGNLIDELNLGLQDDMEEGISKSIEEAIEEGSAEFKIANYFDRELSAVRARSLAIKGFNRDMERVLNELEATGKISLPMFVIVDELDRCRPTFAITVLERINHLFDIGGIVFVIGTDTDQLSHAVNAVYGPNFSSKEYLDRFFSQTYQLRSLNLAQIIDNTISEYGIDSSKFAPVNHLGPLSELKSIVAQVSSSVRHARKILNLVAAFSSLWDRPEKLDEIYLAACAFAVVNQDEPWLKDGVGTDRSKSVTVGPLTSSVVHLPKFGTDTSTTSLGEYCRIFRDAGNQTFLYTLQRDSGRNPILSRAQTLVVKEQNLYKPNEHAHQNRPSWAAYPGGLSSLNSFIA